MLRMYLSCAVLITCDVRNDVGAELCEADITIQYVDTHVIITKTALITSMSGNEVARFRRRPIVLGRPGAQGYSVAYKERP